MANPFLRLIGVTHENRHSVVAQARDAINDCGGWIANFQMFSNISICLNFEVPGRNLAQLQSALTAAKIRLNTESTVSLENLRQSPPPEIQGSLQITFIHHEPDLRREVPAFG